MSGYLGELAEVLGRDPGPHTVTPLRHQSANAITVGIWRYAGDGWSAILKHLSRHGSGAGHWVASDDPSHWNYWLREALAYRSGLAAAAYSDSGIRAPRLLGGGERADGSVTLWLEDVDGLTGSAWDVARVVAFAGQLGRAQGAYLADRPLPDHPWLSRRWLRQYVGSKPVDGALLGDPAAWARAAAYGPLRPRLIRFWAGRDRLLRAVEQMPPTLAHLDVWPANLVARGAETVLLDWAFVGVGAVGEDPGNLVTDCVWDGWLPAAALAELADGVWTAYLGGLREAGWAGDERLARLGFAAGGAVKYAWLAEWSLRRLAAGQLTSYGGYSERAAGELVETYAAALALLLDWADEALSLAGSLA